MTGASKNFNYVFTRVFFVKLREILSTHIELANKLKGLELRIDSHDEQITSIIEAINQLLAPPPEPKRKMGFQIKEKKVLYMKN